MFIAVPFYAGFKANNELPVGQDAFSWPKAILFAVVGATPFSGSMSVIQIGFRNFEICSNEQVFSKQKIRVWRFCSCVFFDF